MTTTTSDWRSPDSEWRRNLEREAAEFDAACKADGYQRGGPALAALAAKRRSERPAHDLAAMGFGGTDVRCYCGWQKRNIKGGPEAAGRAIRAHCEAAA